MKMNLDDIVSHYTNRTMTNDPSFYSGRGAIQGDLNNKRLEMIYQGIKTEIGDEAAQNFVQMVYDIPKLSATDFLIALQNLENHQWKWSPQLQSIEKGFCPKQRSDGGYGIEVLVSGGMFGESARNETAWIRNDFLKNHQDEFNASRDEDMPEDPTRSQAIHLDSYEY